MKLGIKEKKLQLVEIYAANDIFKDGKVLYEKDQLVRSLKSSKKHIRKYLRKLPEDKYYIRIDETQQKLEEELSEVPVFTDSLKRI